MRNYRIYAYTKSHVYNEDVRGIENAFNLFHDLKDMGADRVEIVDIEYGETFAEWERD